MEIQQHLHYTNSRSDQGAPAGGAYNYWAALHSFSCYTRELRKISFLEKNTFSHIFTNDKKNEGTKKDDPVKTFFALVVKS